MTMFIKFTVHVYSFYTLSCSINFRKKCLFGIGSVFEVFKIWGAFWPSGVRIRGNFQILWSISYIMYIFITSDVNKNSTFLEGLLWLQILVYAENTIFQSKFHHWASVCLWNILTGNQVENILISVFPINGESDRFLYFKSGTNLVTTRQLI